MGKSVNRSDRKLDRLKNMIRIALGQSKMVTKPISGILHVVVYIGSYKITTINKILLT